MTPNRTFDLNALAKIATEFRQLDENVIYAHLSSESLSDILSEDHRLFKVEGSVFVLVTSGKFDLMFNSTSYEVSAPAAISFPHGTLVEMNSIGSEPVELELLCYTPAFLQDVNISFSSISGEALRGQASPIMTITDNELNLLMRYFSLIETVISDVYNPPLTRHVLSSLTSAMFYQMMLILYRRLETSATVGEGIGPRRSTYVHDFIKLVHMHYNKERSVNFYAEKLFISPKYLSLLVKEATGRSAARWIDHFVITEAKNLLRYSGKNIQQVAYALNFTNQSSFGKYFKHLTGMSPTEYQKS